MKKNIYIRGVADRGHDVIAELEKRGGINTLHHCGHNPNRLYYIHPMTNQIEFIMGSALLSPLFEEFVLDSGFKPYDAVEVRMHHSDDWKTDIFLHKKESQYVCTTGEYNYCRPYDREVHIFIKAEPKNMKKDEN